MREKGFTLIEILVVIALLAILTATAMFLINPAFQLQKSRDARRKADIKIIQSALEFYRSDVGTYPPATTANGSNVPSAADCPPSLVNNADDALCQNAQDTVYLQAVPKDPKTGLDYYYCYGNTGLCTSPSPNGYVLYSCLENPNDSDRLKVGSTPAIPGNQITSLMNCPSGSVYYGVVNP